MLRVVEAFSGIGSQAKALQNIGAEFEIAATIEWDINATYAYDIIHNGMQELSDDIGLMSKPELVHTLLEMGVSVDGKKPASQTSLKVLSKEALRGIMYAIRRTKNLVDITGVTAEDVPNEVDVFTYSFPCQDLSISGSWHGNMSGISRNANNRSGMLWEVERIMLEHKQINKRLPGFLLMENVSNILSRTHNGDFTDWQKTLENLGYVNQIYTLNALNFGVPQERKRTFMLSVLCEDSVKQDMLRNYFESNDLEKYIDPAVSPLSDYLRTDYANEIYKSEAEESNPFYTPSRRKILMDNDIVFDGIKVVKDTIKTITTKQDRNPNSGIIRYYSSIKQKAPYRNITPRECFLLMGFREDDFDSLMRNNVDVRKGRKIFFREKLIKLAGNSIVVDVLEEIFRQIIDIKENVISSPTKG